MNPLFLAIRAISSEFARRIYLPLVWVAGSVLALVVIIASWLVTMSAWWLILLIPAILISVVFIIVAVIAGLAIRMLSPRQNKDQRKAISMFVDKLLQVAEVLSTPKFILLFRLVKDTLFPSGDGFIGEVTSHAKTLKPDFQDIIASFK